MKSFEPGGHQFRGHRLGRQHSIIETPRRPADISDDPAAQAEWDNAFPLLLGRYSQTSEFDAFDRSGTQLPQYTNTRRDFHYNEYEFYGQDSWKVRRDLTITYGLRWQYPQRTLRSQRFPVGSESEHRHHFPGSRVGRCSGSFRQRRSTTGELRPGRSGESRSRLLQARAIATLVRVSALAYAPSFTNGCYGRIFGDRKTTVRAGGAIVYDRVLSTLSFELDQQTFLFDSNPILNYGPPAGDPVQTSPTANSLLSPRFTSLTASAASADAASGYAASCHSERGQHWRADRLAVLGGFPELFCSSTRTSRRLIPTRFRLEYSANYPATWCSKLTTLAAWAGS